MRVDEERLKFVRYWAKIVKTTDPKYWSEQQRDLIDAMIKSANQDVELYLKVKRISKKIAQELKNVSMKNKK